MLIILISDWLTGYWKKFADFEKRNGTAERVIEVFEEGVKAIPLSVDLWIHYLNHIKNICRDDQDAIRTLYERSVSDCGREWKSDKLWDNYVKWEQVKIILMSQFHNHGSCLSLSMRQTHLIFNKFIKNSHTVHSFSNISINKNV